MLSRDFFGGRGKMGGQEWGAGDYSKSQQEKKTLVEVGR